MMQRKLKAGEKRKIVKPGWQVRRALGRDEVERVVRVELTFTFEEWDRIEDKALNRGMYPRAWLMALVKKKIGSS